MSTAIPSLLSITAVVPLTLERQFANSDEFVEEEKYERTDKFQLTHCSSCNRTVIFDDYNEARMYAFTPSPGCPWGDACLRDPLYRSIQIINQ